MGREKQGNGELVRLPDGQPEKKPYTKPVVRTLGTVRELTQVTHSGLSK